MDTTQEGGGNETPAASIGDDGSNNPNYDDEFQTFLDLVDVLDVNGKHANHTDQVHRILVKDGSIRCIFVSANYASVLGKIIQESLNLKIINIHSSNLTVDFFKAVFGGVGRYECQLEELDLMRSEDLCLDKMRTLSSFLQNMSHLKVLNLSKVNLTTDGCRILFDNLVETARPESSIETLLLHENDLGQDGARALVPLLGKMNHLRCLGLMNTKLDDYCVSMIAEAMDGLISLRSLDISCNNIGDVGLEKLLSLSNSNSWECIRISERHFGDCGHQILADFLKRVDINLECLHLERPFNWQMQAEENIQDEREWILGIDRMHTLHLLLHAISSKSCLKVLCANIPPSCMKQLEGPVEKMLCDITSFEALCQSNHQIQSISYPTYQPISISNSVDKIFHIHKTIYNIGKNSMQTFHVLFYWEFRH